MRDARAVWSEQALLANIGKEHAEGARAGRNRSVLLSTESCAILNRISKWLRGQP
jgi:hypothetical protein